MNIGYAAWGDGRRRDDDYNNRLTEAETKPLRQAKRSEAKQYGRPQRLIRIYGERYEVRCDASKSSPATRF